MRKEPISPTEGWQLFLDRLYLLSMFLFFYSLSSSICSYYRQPKAFVLNKQLGYSRGFLAWNMSDYEDIEQRNSKRAILVKQSKLIRSNLPSRLPKLQEKKVSRHFPELA